VTATGEFSAALALGDAVKGTVAKGSITVCTHQDGDDVLVSISDTSCGIRERARGRIFAPFLTIKEVGKATKILIRLPIAGKGQRALGASL
jgi:signal transduction histidine kinase